MGSVVQQIGNVTMTQSVDPSQNVKIQTASVRMPCVSQVHVYKLLVWWGSVAPR